MKTDNLQSSARKQFSIFESNPQLVYLDNAASTQTPDVVLEAMNQYYQTHRSNVHRGLYPLSEQATELYENARKKVANFISAKPDEIVFTSGTTHSLNMLAYSLCRQLRPGDNIVLTQSEHHANIVPWQVMKERYGFELRFISVTDTVELDMEKAQQLIDHNTKIISIGLVSNVTGTINPIDEILPLAKSVGAITILDAAQAVAHMPLDVKRIDADFMAFSGHKMYGPTGIGVLYGKKEMLEQIEPFIFGGEMVKEVTLEKATWTELPHRLEAGTPPIAEAIGLGAAIDFIQSIGWINIVEHEVLLTLKLISELKKISGIKIIGEAEKRIGVVSFIMEDIHPHDIADIAGKQGVALRAGHHCAMPLMNVLQIPGTVRASVGIYNTEDDVDTCINALKHVREIFSR